MIEANNLVRRYGEFAAVDDVSFNISPGEVVGLLGHNGAGKSTIMKMLTGYLGPTAGEVRVDGISVQAEPLSVQARMGYLPENLPIYPEMTVAEYLSFAAQLRGLKPRDVVPQAVARTQLKEKVLDRLDTLSRGYKQRVGVAQAILHNPKFLILDEPSNGLDPNQIQQMRGLIRQLAEQATVILSTHIMQEVSAVCDRAIIIRNGKIAIDERLADLRRSNHLRVRSLANAGDPLGGALAPLAFVRHSHQESPGLWHVEVDREVDQAAADISRALIAAELPVYEISPITRDLEVIFKEVNEGGLQGEV